MAKITAKFVRTLAPGGATLNFTGITGNSHKAVAMPLTLIKKALDRGVKVYELIEIKDEDNEVIGYEDLELTEENYASDNGGKEVTASNNIVPDVEKEREDIHAAEMAERLAEKGLEIKERQEALAAQNNQESEESDDEEKENTSFDINQVDPTAIPEGFGTTTLTADEQELADSLKAEGKTDSQILAAIKELRDTPVEPNI